MRFATAPALAILLSITSGCGKASTPAPDAAAVPSDTTTNTAVVPPAVADSMVTKTNESLTATNVIADAETVDNSILEEQIYMVANSDHTSHEKAEELFKMFAKLDWQGQRKVAFAALKQIDDAGYPLLRKYLLDPKLDARVLSAFMTDTLKRKNSIKLPALLDLAQIDGHPLRDESRELLHALLQANHGTNWAKWEQAVETSLQSNPN